MPAALVLAGWAVARAAAGPAPDPAASQAGQWSPYVVGFGIGILSCISFLISNRPIGVSTAYAQTSGMIGRLVAGSRVDRMPYYRAVKPEIGWEWMLALGVLLGAWLSAVLSGELRVEAAPPLWVAEFGPGAALALAGGRRGRGAPGGRVALGGRLHQRARHQRHPAAGRRQLAGRGVLFRRRCRHRLHAVLMRRSLHAGGVAFQ